MPKDQDKGKDEGVTFDLPEDLSTLGSDELAAKFKEAQDLFDQVRTDGDLDDAKIVILQELADAAQRCDAELKARKAKAEENDAKADELAKLFTPEAKDEPSEDDTKAEDVTDGETVDTPTDADTPAPEGDSTETADAPAEGDLVTASGKTPATPKKGPVRLNVPLDEVRRRQRAADQGPAHTVANITAAANIPGMEIGGAVTSVREISEAFHKRARGLPANGSAGDVEVVNIHRQFEHTIGLDASPEQAMAILRAAADPEYLVAAGGWCAPSLVIYDFFNIAEADGLIDLPTVNASRGGIRFPISPSIAEFLDDIWLWTESNDILAVTGTGTKPCARPACPTFDEERLAMHGYCVTAGNLTEWAYPELIDNFINLTVAAHMHVMSQRRIAAMVADSTAVTTAGAGVSGATASILNSIELQVVDYRLKYRMSDSAVLEAVFPTWTYAIIRADLAKRNGYADPFDVSDEMIRAWFDRRGVRVQFVQDWQVGSGDFPGQTAARTDWPANLQFLLYAAGTWVLGNGPTINLGVTRDSTLNAKNDHTAAWSEEGDLVAKMGHESRIVTVAVDPNGQTGLQVAMTTGV